MGRWQTIHARAFRRVLVALVLLSAVWVSPATAAPPCPGDCVPNGTVSTDELVRTLQIALGNLPVSACEGADVDGSATVAVDEVVAAVESAIAGCPTFADEYAGSVTLDGGRTATIEVLVDEDGMATGDVTILEASGSRLASMLGAGAGGVSFSISGSVDLETGVFHFSGSYSNGSQTFPINLNGTLPLRLGLTGTLSFHIGTSVFDGDLSRLDRRTPTPTRTPTPHAGKVHTIKVGQPNLPFDPEYLEIDIGDTVVWTWVGGTHSVRSTNPSDPNFPKCTSDGRFDSGTKSSGEFELTFTMPGQVDYHCGLPGHCEQFESGIIVVRGTPSPTPTPTFTIPPSPTATRTPELIGGISRAFPGIYSGQFITQFGNTALRVEIRVEGEDQRIILADLNGFFLGVGAQLQMMVVTPTKLSYVSPDPFNMRSMTLELTGPGQISGTHVVVQPGGMGTYTATIELTKEP